MVTTLSILSSLFKDKYIRIKETNEIVFSTGIQITAGFFNGYELCGKNIYTGKPVRYNMNSISLIGVRSNNEFIDSVLELVEIVDKPKILETEIFKALTEG